MEIKQTTLVTTWSQSTHPDEILWDAVVKTEGFLSSPFGEYVIFKRPLQCHCSACVFEQESLDGIVLPSFHNSGLCKDEAEELSRNQKNKVLYICHEGLQWSTFLQSPMHTPLQTIHLFPKTAIRPKSVHWTGDHESSLAEGREEGDLEGLQQLWGVYVSPHRWSLTLRSCQLIPASKGGLWRWWRA